MPKFRATVQLVGLEGVDSAEVRRAFEAGLAKGGFERWHVVSIERHSNEKRVEPLTRAEPFRPPRRPANPPPQINMGGVLLVAAAVWVVWLFLALTEQAGP